jgi:ketosteroid isomerase-like protein
LGADPQELFDRQQIAELCTRYASAVDARDFAGVADCFTRDGSLETALPPRIMRGREEIERVLATQTSTVLAAQHLVTNHSYTVDGDAGVGTSAFVMFRWPKEQEWPGPLAAHGGAYIDLLERTADGWKIKHRRIEILWGPGEFAVTGNAG